MSSLYCDPDEDNEDQVEAALVAGEDEGDRTVRSVENYEAVDDVAQTAVGDASCVSDFVKVLEEHGELKVLGSARGGSGSSVDGG